MAEPLNVNPTPRHKFSQEHEALSQHRELMQNVWLNRAIEIALLQMQRQQGGVADRDVTAAATNHFKVQGALEFLEIFRNLSHTPRLPSKTQPTDQLRY